MSVRRLAEVSVQPASFAFLGENVDWAARTIQKYPEGRQQSAVIPLLMRAQEQEGWVTKAAIEHVAGMLRMPLIRVLEVATFYTQFQLKPVGSKAHIQVCGTTPCMLRGSDALKRVCEAKIHPEQFHLNASGSLSWEEVECLGACVNAPMVMISKDTFEDLTPERLEDIIARFDAGEGEAVPVGPQIDRHLSAPLGGLTSLTSDAGLNGTERQDRSGPAAPGAPPQGDGAGGSVSTPPSNAAKPRSSAPETDPTIAGKGKATHENVDQGAEKAAGVDASEGASVPGAGRTGGSFQGPTGAGGKENGAENMASVSADADVVRRDGPLGIKGDQAESAVVQDFVRVDPPEGKTDEVKGAPAVDSSAGRSDIDVPLEARRESDDILPGPVSDDHIETNEEKRAAASAGDGAIGGMLETDGPTPMGRKPSGLVAEPQGTKDDLKVIKGIGAVLEAKLNELGVFHFSQIAGWSTEELLWIDDHLNFRGRAVRERWIEQAKTLMSSGSATGPN